MGPKGLFFIKKGVRTRTLGSLEEIQSKFAKTRFNSRLTGPFLDAVYRRENGLFLGYPDKPLSVFSKSL
jgi:hypothetical protein